MRHCPHKPSPPTRPLEAKTHILKVPFGLRQGRLFNPKQVPPGRKCGCICPGCGAPLVAKALSSVHRHPHFAHLGNSHCQAGYESALHLMAKQILQDSGWLTLPAWDGDVGMLNPPQLADDDGLLWHGERVDFPSRRTRLTEVRLEQAMGDYTPDATCWDEEKEELLVEIKVTHAVGATKQSRLQGDDRRCFEIDLSHLLPADVLDESALRDAVLFEPANRTWIACSEATEAWRASLRNLKTLVAERNRTLAQEGAQRQSEAAEAAQLAVTRSSELQAQQDRKQHFRQQQRLPHAARLERLPELVSTERVEQLLEEYLTRDGAASSALLTKVANADLRKALTYCGTDAWIYNVHPSLWQTAAYHQFVAHRNAGAEFNGRDVARWVMKEFGRDSDLWELFRAQYEFRAKARTAGFSKNRISFWAFTELENRQIPNFYKPINQFLERLTYLGALDRTDGTLGGFRAAKL